MDYFTPESLFLTILLGATFFLIFNTLSHYKRRQYSSNIQPPSPRGFPIIGHLHLLTDMPHHSLARIADRLGPIVFLRLGRVPTVVISSARLAGLVLKTYDHVFSNRPQIVAAQYLSFGCSDVTFSRYGPYWRQTRMICVSNLLSTKRVSSFQLVRLEETKRMLSHVLSACRSGSDREVNMSEVFFTLANNVLCRAVSGRRFPKKEGQNRHLTAVLMVAQTLFGGFCTGDFYPGWEYLVDRVSRFQTRLERSLEDMTNICDEIIKEHVDRLTDSREEDFVDVLFRAQRREDLEVPMTDDNLKALVMDMFVAGTDTTSAVFEWTLTELVRDPEIMKKAQEEVRKIACSARTVDESHLQHFHYMKAVVKETMRLHPPVPLLVPRESMEDCILDGYEIRAKTRVLINSYAIGRDPESWEDPLKYDPERFKDHHNEFKHQHLRFLPFGGGRRGCPGYDFGLATIELGLALLLYHFDWALPEGVGADDVNLDEIFGLVTRKKTPLIVLPTANKDYEFKAF